MAGFSSQRRIAAEILKVGETKIWIDPEHKEEIKNAITRADIKKMISHGYIKKRPDKIRIKKMEKVKKQGVGSRKGKKGARLPKKRKWINTIRPLRRMLKELRDEKKIDEKNYRRLYMLAKGGVFRSRTHLKLYLKQRGIVEDAKEKT
ncbi:MAG: 50S ribosomal protein L19e [Candidatus Aenigmarchaeota archaeon]|nr:50S ribosomal protein L19e [Candidatus Aenigmarchaeota archaeon]